MKKFTFLLLSTLACGWYAQGQSGTTESIERHRIWIAVQDTAGAYHETLIGYVTGATIGVDPGYDGHLLGGNQIKIYSVINNDKFAIQARPLPFDINDVVSLGFQSANEQEVTISLNRKDGLFADQMVYIHDSYTETCQNLQESAYTFLTDPGVFHDRFTIIYQNQALGNEDFTAVKDFELAVKPQQWIGLNSREPLAAVEIYNLKGQRVADWNTTATTRWETAAIHLAPGVYMLKAKTVNGAEHFQRMVF